MPQDIFNPPPHFSGTLLYCLFVGSLDGGFLGFLLLLSVCLLVCVLHTLLYTCTLIELSTCPFVSDEITHIGMKRKSSRVVARVSQNWWLAEEPEREEERERERKRERERGERERERERERGRERERE